MTDTDAKATGHQPDEKELEVEAGTPCPAAAEEKPAAALSEQAVSAEEVEGLRRQIEEEKRKAAENYDQWLRSVAELRNYKKRVDQEREMQSREANAALIAQLLPVLDNFDRAMENLPDEKLLHFSWMEGILLIYRRLQAVLEQFGLRPIDAVDKAFDPYVHEAILFEEAPPEKNQRVLAELQKGYKLYDRVIRPTLVKVGRAAAPAQEPAEEKSASAEEITPPQGQE